MCRIAAYMGAPGFLNDILLAPEHGLSRQAWDAREMESATVNADGWGAAWLDDDDRPAVYRNILPIWADVNVEPLARSLRSRLWLGNVRSATPGLGTDHANTQPFCDEHLLFTHNGFVDRFATTLRARLRAELAPAVETSIVGNTDSEYLFALLRQQAGDPVTRVRTAIALLRGWLAETPDVRALLAFVLTDGERLVAVRTAINARAPSLYYHADWRAGTMIASEPFDTDSGWTRIETDTLVVVDRQSSVPVVETL